MGMQVLRTFAEHDHVDTWNSDSYADRPHRPSEHSREFAFFVSIEFRNACDMPTSVKKEPPRQWCR